MQEPADEKGISDVCSCIRPNLMPLVLVCPCGCFVFILAASEAEALFILSRHAFYLPLRALPTFFVRARRGDAAGVKEKLVS